MSESMKPRFAVDLNEIERQLAQAQSVPAQPASSGRGDPLAELARIVGQEDPFQSLLADGQPQRRQAAQPGHFDDLFAVRPGAAAPARAPQPQQREPSFHIDESAYDDGSYAQADRRAQPQAYAYQAQQPAYDDAGYDDQGYYDDQGGQYAPEDYDDVGQDDYEPVGKRRSRKGLIAVGAVLGAAVVGAGAAFFMGGTASVVRGGEPPLITASQEPIKVQPQNPGGVEIPNQNKQIYEPNNQNPDTKVVTRTEQPIDVKQAVRMSGADATGATANGMQPAMGLNLGEPRKVRTITIRPDGTVVSPDGAREAAAAPAPAPAIAPPAMTMPAAAQPQMAQAPVTPQPKPAAATPAPAAPKPAAAAEAPSDASPQPKPQRVASAQPTPIAPTAATEAVEAAPTGDYSVQLGLANSEARAEKALVGFQKKYPDLEGQPAMIRKAELNGNTIFRVRVGPMSREDASTLCSKVQGQGGQCFVAKN